MKKTCYRCKEEKELTDFTRSAYVKSGYKNLCLVCKNTETTKYYHQHREKMDARAKEYRSENQKYLSEASKNKRRSKLPIDPDFVPRVHYKGRSQEDAKIYQQAWHRQYNIENKDMIATKVKERRPQINKQRRARYKEDPNFKIGANFRTRVYDELKNNKKTSSIKLLGCSIEEFRKWIENHFLEGMSWENWGLGDKSWHLDHHYPCAAFDLTNQEHQKQCFHYTNIYPMWAEDNLSKNDDIPSTPRENIYVPNFVKKATDS